MPEFYCDVRWQNDDVPSSNSPSEHRDLLSLFLASMTALSIYYIIIINRCVFVRKTYGYSMYVFVS